MQDKLKLGDFSAVDLLSSQTVAGGEPAVQSVACAAFGRGEIAEQEICWHDALRHFETAARLEDNKDHLAGLVRLLRLLGRTSEAVPLAVRAKTDLRQLWHGPPRTLLLASTS